MNTFHQLCEVCFLKYAGSIDPLLSLVTYQELQRKNFRYKKELFHCITQLFVEITLIYVIMNVLHHLVTMHWVESKNYPYKFCFWLQQALSMHLSWYKLKFLSTKGLNQQVFKVWFHCSSWLECSSDSFLILSRDPLCVDCLPFKRVNHVSIMSISDI